MATRLNIIPFGLPSQKMNYRLSRRSWRNGQCLLLKWNGREPETKDSAKTWGRKLKNFSHNFQEELFSEPRNVAVIVMVGFLRRALLLELYNDRTWVMKTTENLELYNIYFLSIVFMIRYEVLTER